MTTVAERRLRPMVPLRLRDVVKTYGQGDNAVRALDGVSLDVPPATFVAVMGPSGSGKSTLMHCAAGLDVPTSGTITLADQVLTDMTDDALTALRRERVAFVFQSFNLLPTLDVIQNVALPATLAGRRVERRRVLHAIERVGLGDRARHLPAQLSGGQQQRVAIARAMVAEADVLFADEPTGALDSVSAHRILRLLRAAVDETGQTIMMTTHDPIAAAHADAVLFLVDGRLADRLDRPTAAQVAEYVAAQAGQRMTEAG
ncbi:ABC transporter ATP-binding protein [Dactylosporangium sp. CA-052675]|uniref:ABC transporter ATP-binding protein n=1 Tax=Dactylosporangium sp. CA-052675 TaxID=3239927 RepID=UPI003D8C263D